MISPPELMIIALIGLLWVLPTWFIIKKTGYHPALSLLVVIPFLNLALILFIAFSKWPIIKELEEMRAKIDESKSY